MIRYSPSNVRTIAAALGTDPTRHDFALADASTGRVLGVYTSERLAVEAAARHAGPGRVLALTVLHPARCRCPEAR